MVPRFFIDHRVFANVIAVITIIFGIVALRTLPVEQYPPITPPTVQVRASYPGANATVLANTVASPLEQQINGVENMLYMTSSSSASDGSYALTITFDIGTDLDKAQVLVQNRVAVAEPRLPAEVRQVGVTVLKQSTDIVLVASLLSPDGRYNSLFLANYASLNLRDELSRVAGVGDVRISGAGDYSMRIWLDPERLRARQLTAQDVVNALRDQNVQVAAGQIGQPPTTGQQQFQYTVTAQGRYSDVDQFRRVVVKTGEGGRVVRLEDVARVELGAQSYDTFAQRNGRETANLLIYQLPGANALDVSSGVRAALARMAESFPPGLTYEVPLDTTAFVRAGIKEVYRTLAEAGVLVLIVILAFLQSWRALLVPATTVPVTIIGAFAFLYVLGFSVNFLTLFGLVLAIGIVVDDAILIVENASHHVERGLPPREATIKAMSEVTGPVIGITMVLMAVFLPASFLGGVTGRLYRQFALTIAATALISAINALTLKPAQCAQYLRAAPPRRNWAARAFNAVYAATEHAYSRLVGFLLRSTAIVVPTFVALLILTGWWYASLPGGFLPTEDQGNAIVSIQLPDAASQQRTRALVEKVNGMIDEERQQHAAVEGWFVLGGLSLIDGTSLPNAATIFVTYRPWEERTRPEQSQPAILARLARKFGTIEEGVVFPIVPPSIRGLGTTGGLQFQVQDRGGIGLEALQDRVQQFVVAGRSRPELGPLNTNFRAAVPQIRLHVDETKSKQLGLAMNDVYAALQTYLGSTYVNDFTKFGRVYQVRAQADASFRDQPDDLRRLEVRNREGGMVPLATLLSVEKSYGPPIVIRHNLYPSALITGTPAPSYSSGQALDAIESLSSKELSGPVAIEWTGVAFQERLVGGQALSVFGMAVLLVYLVLAAQYEIWILPIAVVLTVPLGLLGAVAAASIRGLGNDVYAQVGVVLIIALASKNAIVVVEFARELRLAGRSIVEAAHEAARLRFRPILMTSFAFVLGVVPLVFAIGAGAASRRSLGTAVFGGMLSATFLTVLFVPVFFSAAQRLSEWISGPTKHTAAQTGSTSPPSAAQAPEGERHPPLTPAGFPRNGVLRNPRMTVRAGNNAMRTVADFRFWSAVKRDKSRTPM
ncbi:MAG: efflux RND transporter permease subunit [Gemmataceae bacterium]